MSARLRRVAGVVLVVASLLVAWQVSARHRASLLREADVAARASVTELAEKARAGLRAEAASVATSAASGAQLLKDLVASASNEGLEDTLADAFENEPWWHPLSSVGSTAFFLGGRQVYLAAELHTPVAQLPALVERASSSGQASELVVHEGVPLLVGAARCPEPNRQQAWGVVALLARVTPERLARVGTGLGATLALARADGHAVVSSETTPELSAFLATDAVASPCCARVPLEDGLTLAVARPASTFIAAAEAEAGTASTITWALAAVVALLGVALALWPRSKAAEEQSKLLHDTAAQLRQSQEELKRLSQSFPPATALAHGVAPPQHDDGLGSTKVSHAQSRYEVVAPLGEGGMARVAVAVTRGAEGFRRTFVLKRLRPELSENQEVVNQFIDEARLGAGLVHSNIVPVFDFGRDAEGYYLAQEYILGRDLDALITASKRQLGRPLTPQVVAWVAQEALKALAYAHGKTDDAGRPMGLVHRDVSPNNLMVSARGELKLLDFGIVKSDLRLTRTTPGVVKGNLFFMAPEQARGLEVDPRADLWSLGQVLFTAATGDTLYQGDNQYELMTRAAAGLTENDRHQLADLPPALRPFIERLLSNDPAQRFASADEAARAVPQPVASPGEVQALIDALVGDELRAEQARLSPRDP